MQNIELKCVSHIWLLFKLKLLLVWFLFSCPAWSFLLLLAKRHNIMESSSFPVLSQRIVRNFRWPLTLCWIWVALGIITLLALVALEQDVPFWVMLLFLPHPPPLPPTRSGVRGHCPLKPIASSPGAPTLLRNIIKNSGLHGPLRKAINKQNSKQLSAKSN